MFNLGKAVTIVFVVLMITEADVWGRIRRTNEAARAQYLATEEARRGVMLTLAAISHEREVGRQGFEG